MILRDRLLHLPQELIISIASFLNKPDLAACVRVSHQWHHIFNSILWYTFDDGCQLSSNVFTRQHKWDDLKWLEPALRNNIQHIRHLVIHSSQTIEVCATNGCRSLLSITLPDMIPFQPPKTYIRRTKSRPVSALAMQNIAPRPRQICLDPDEAELENMLEKLIIDPRFENGVMKLPGTWFSDQDELEFRHVQQFWILVERNRATLQSLSINDDAAKVLTSFRDNAVLLEFLRPCSGLRFLRIPRQRGLDLDELLKCFPHLNCLQLGFCNDHMGKYEPSGYTFRSPPPSSGQVAQARAGSPVTRPYPQLPLLVDLTINDDISASKIACLLEWMPTLTHLSFLSFDQVTAEPYQPSTLRLSSAEKLLLHRIKSFQLTSNDPTHKRREVPLLQLMPNLEQLAMPLVSNDIIDTLCSHNPLLHTFRRSTDPKRRMRMYESGTPTYLRKLLEQCTHLTTLDIVQHWINLSDWVDNEDEPWACRGLQVFRCSIRNLWRCSDDRDGDDDVAMAAPDRRRDLSNKLRRIEESSKAERRLFRKLAQLHRLQVLEFGVEHRIIKRNTLALVKDASGKVGEPHRRLFQALELERFEDTLRLTLGTGLDELGTLKELRVFGFEGVAHRITERELEWMVRSWPKLDVMRGLSYDRRVTIGDKARQRRDRLREFVQGLKPSVVHESLFKYSSSIDDVPPNGNI